MGASYGGLGGGPLGGLRHHLGGVALLFGLSPRVTSPLVAGGCLGESCPMAISTKEAVASLRLLVSVARADGVLHDEEKKVLESTLDELWEELPDEANLESFLDEDVDLDEQLGKLKSDDAREEAYRSAYLLAHADGECSSEEQELLERIEKKLKITSDQVKATEQLIAPDDREEAPPTLKHIEDPDERDAVVQRETLKCAVMSAVFGAFPVPGLAIATDLAVVGFQVNLVRDIGHLWGQQVDKKSAKSLLAALGLGTGVRLAVSNLLKFLPGWGSLAGATTAFASTYAVGHVINKHFADPREDLTALKEDFDKAEKKGKKAYAENKDAIEEKQRLTKDSIAVLNTDRKEGKLSQAEYEDRVSMI